MTTRTPNIQLSALVAESGLTYEALAKAVRAVAAECGARLHTNKSNVEHWLSGSVPRGDTPRYLAVALSRRLGRLLTPLTSACPPQQRPRMTPSDCPSGVTRWTPCCRCGGASWTAAAS